MTKNRKLKSLSLIALIVSVFPLTTLIPVFLKATLPQGVNTAWACVNIITVLTGLILSVVCVKNRESRSAVNITSTVISVFWAFVMLSILALALFLNVVQ